MVVLVPMAWCPLTDFSYRQRGWLEAYGFYLCAAVFGGALQWGGRWTTQRGVAVMGAVTV